MPETILTSVKDAREEAYAQVSPVFSPTDRRNVVFLLTLGNMSREFLGERKNINEYLRYLEGEEGQREVLTLAREFDLALVNLNSTAGQEIDPKLINTRAVREETKLGRNGTVPLLLGEQAVRPHEAAVKFEKGVETLSKQERYMRYSEMGLRDEEFRKWIKEKGKWSEIHLNAIDAKHFLATLLVDLYPGMVRRYIQASGGHQDLDTDELVRAICESMDRKSEIFGLINDQGWFTEEEFSKEFVRSAQLSSLENELSKVEGGERNKVRSLLLTRVASGLEARHEGKKAGPVWMLSNADLESLIKADPQEAFNSALETLNLKETQEDHDQYRVWLKGNALTILSDRAMKPLVIQELKTDNSQIIKALASFLDYRIPDDATTAEALSDYPQCFNLIMSLLIINGLQGEALDSLSDLRNKSDKLLQEASVKHLIGVYNEIPDTRELVDPLYKIVTAS